MSHGYMMETIIFMNIDDCSQELDRGHYKHYCVVQPYHLLTIDFMFSIGFPAFFFQNLKFYYENIVTMLYSKYRPSEATTFPHLSGN